jgi:arylsulfatase A-like enzyme
MGIHGGPTGLTPQLDKIANSATVFEHAWAPAPRTRPSFRSATTGRWPRDARTAPTLGTLLSKHGLKTAGFVANVQLSAELGFSEGFDTWALDNMAPADEQVDAALSWLNTYQDQDAFLFVHLMDPHIFYTAPEPFLDRFTDPIEREGLPNRYNRKRIEEQQRLGLLSAAQKRWIQGRHKGEVAYMDQAIGRLVTTADAMPGDTWVVIHSDHGEEFWDHGGFEHNHSLHDELLRAVFWIRPPEGLGQELRRIEAPVSLVDLAPTVLGFLGADSLSWPTFDGVDLSPFVRGEDTDDLAKRLTNRPLQIGHMMYAPEQWGVVVGADKYILTTATGETTWTHNNTRKVGRSVALEGALSEATGAPILSGWRLRFTHLSDPIRLQSDKPVGHTEVIDPEAIRRYRANLEWGERPEKDRTEVATITLSSDRREILITPSAKPSGVVFIGGAPEHSTLSAVCDGVVTALQVGPSQKACGQDITLFEGPYLRLPAPEPPSTSTSPSAETTAALQQLGYLD